MKRRHGIDVVAKMLTVARGGVLKTRIMHRSNISYRQLEKYLELLLRTGFLRKDGRIYTTTSKGSDYLQKYSQLSFFLKELKEKEGMLDAEEAELKLMVSKTS